MAENEMTLLERVRQMVSAQLASWELAGRNHAALRTVQTREFSFDGFSVYVQFNPSRIVSSGAKVDAASVTARPCFLCPENRPVEQLGIAWRDYDILLNPYPVFASHLTIAHKGHCQQEIAPYLTDMFALSRELPGYALFYNGSRCGASAPDHQHFQAVPAASLPVVGDYGRLKQTHAVQYDRTGRAVTYIMRDYLRTLFCIESAHADALEIAIMKLYNMLMTEPFVEPMMNVVCVWGDEGWRLFVFPRAAFRPWQYSADDERTRLLISPAAVEMAGVMITPLREHFERITAADIADIYSQVSMKL